MQQQFRSVDKETKWIFRPTVMSLGVDFISFKWNGDMATNVITIYCLFWEYRIMYVTKKIKQNVSDN